MNFLRKVGIIILFFVIFVFSLNTVQSYNENDVSNIMNNFYSKLDNSISDTEVKIKKLEKISNKINIIKKTKWDKITFKSKKLLTLMDVNIVNKINFYIKKLESEKEEINIIDLLGDNNLDDSDVNLNNNEWVIINAGFFNKTYLNAKEWDIFKIWEFDVNGESDENIRLKFVFDYGSYWYPGIRFKTLYIVDNIGKKIYYDSNYGSMGAQTQYFDNIKAWKSYVMYWVLEDFNKTENFSLWVRWTNVWSIWTTWTRVNNKIGKIQFIK